MARRTVIVIICTALIFLSTVALRHGDRLAASGSDLLEQMRLLMEVLTIVKNYYVEEVSVAQLINGAIHGMLNELDPHSMYISADEAREINEHYAGYFDGVGIEFVMQNKIPTVVAPIVGGPSELLGIRPGDRILKIDNETTTTMSEEEVKKKLRGPVGSKVMLTIKRPGVLQPFKMNLHRDRIPIYSIICYFLLDDRTGYIRLGNFSSTTATELEHALNNLDRIGMQQLLLDLRSNSGGLFEQAYAVADKFISGGKRIVYTRGRIPNSTEDFYATDVHTHDNLPLIVLIDHGSASAAEIVAGAIQDWDRGLIVGETSFGKALVQSQVPLSNGSALRLTVARYYTPCGRLIQQSYENADDNFVVENAHSPTHSSVAPDGARPTFWTKGGRKVYGGGGIVPDVEVRAQELTPFTYTIQAHNIFFEYGSLFASQNRERAQNFQAYKSKFYVDDKMMSDFRRLIMRREIAIDEEAYGRDLDYYRQQIKSEIARHLWNSSQYFEVQIVQDIQVQGAMALFDKARLLVGVSKS